MRVTISFLVVSLMVLCGEVSAQQQLPIRRGQHVRLTAPDCGMHGQTVLFDALRGDTLVLVLGTSTMRCVRTSVTRLQYGYGRESYIVEGVIAGLLFGGTAGAVVGAATYEECVPEGWFDCFLPLESEGQAAALGSIVGALLGAGLGAITGAFIETDPWEELQLDRLSVSFVPKRDGFALGVTYRF